MIRLANNGSKERHYKDIQWELFLEMHAITLPGLPQIHAWLMSDKRNWIDLRPTLSRPTDCL